MTYLFKDAPNKSFISFEKGNTKAIVRLQQYISDSESETLEHFLSEKDIFHLIGALHLIQKELKEAKNG